MPVWFQQFVQDLRFAARNLRAHPAFTIAAAAALAIGIAAATLVFSLCNGLFLDSLPYPNAERLVFLHESRPERPDLGLNFDDFTSWRAANQSFTDMAIYQENSGSLAVSGDAIRIYGASVTWSLGATLGIKPLLGRDFRQEDDRPGATPVLLLGFRIWQSRFGGSPDIVGKTIRLDAEPQTVIGILPPNTVFPEESDYWVPFGLSPGITAWIFDGVGRLKPGVTIAQAKQDLLRVHRALAAQRPMDRSTQPTVASLRDRYLGSYRILASALLVGVTVLLLIACANVAGLTIARGMTRSREIAVRTALGAGKGRVIRQFLAESLALAVAGGAIGIGLGLLALRLILRSMTGALPSWVQFRFDFRLALFACLVTALAAVLAGIAPAFALSKTGDLRGALCASAFNATFSRTHRLLMNGLIAGEIALALILSVDGSLYIEAFRKILNAGPGMDVDNVTTFTLNAAYGERERRHRFYQSILDDMRLLPGVSGAGAADELPPADRFHSGNYYAAAETPNQPIREMVATRQITPGYFGALGAHIKEGREYGDFDRFDSAVVVNASFAHRFWPDAATVLGRQIRSGPGEKWLTVIGVADDIRNDGLDQTARPCVWLLYDRGFPAYMSFAVHSNLSSRAVIAAARDAVRRADPGLALFDAQTMRERLNRPLWLRRAASWLLGLASIVAFALAIAGIYTLVAYTAAQRTREIGIRVALGASLRQIVTAMLREGTRLLVCGVSLGFVGLWITRQAIRTVLADDSIARPLPYLTVTAALLIAALVANLLPAMRAASLRPAAVLRSE